MTAAMPVIVFDVNEALSDLSPMGERFSEIGAPAQLDKLWFATLLGDGFALTASGDNGSFAKCPDLDRPVQGSSNGRCALMTLGLHFPASAACVAFRFLWRASFAFGWRKADSERASRKWCFGVANTNEFGTRRLLRKTSGSADS